MRFLRKFDSRDIILDDDGNDDGLDDENNNNHNNTDINALDRQMLIVAKKLKGDRWLNEDASPVMEHLRESPRMGFGKPLPISAEHGDGITNIAVVIDRILDQKRRFRERVERDTKWQTRKLQLKADMDTNRNNKEYEKIFPVTEPDLQVAVK